MKLFNNLLIFLSIIILIISKLKHSKNRDDVIIDITDDGTELNIETYQSDYNETTHNSTIIHSFHNLSKSKNDTILNGTSKNITSEDLFLIIADQIESIKNEICTNCLEIDNFLNQLILEIREMKKEIDQINGEDKLSNKIFSKQQVFNKISQYITDINLIKTGLFKLNEFLDTLQKANCKNFADSLKKYNIVVNSVNKLIQIIQNSITKFKININIVVLN